MLRHSYTHTHTHTGYGFVEFETQAAQKQALAQMNGFEL
jgi:RNA recognition motif-containing protein